ncbi:DUF3285 domain-containing protein [Tumidithrix helvetica PCC 7403]|uniref:DUF3285 domain-containing protein n=1 Tax=Tumidithrix helvetica TaxID=3457545 RepID=UPI003C7F99D5
MTPDSSPTNAPLRQTTKDNAEEKKDSYVKLAMRNMVKKRATSLFHFALTTAGVIGLLVGLAVVFH